MNRLQDFSRRALNGNEIDESELVAILDEEDSSEVEKICQVADQIRATTIGSQVCIHGIIEFSSYCRNNCLYCGLRSDNRELPRHRLTPEEIIDTACRAVNIFGYKMLVLQSGEDLEFTTDKLVYILKRIFEKCRPLIFLSIGERDLSTYEKLYLSGARGILFRFETSDSKLYGRFHPEHKFEDRLNHVRFLRDIGYIVATGSLIGLPGQTNKSIAKDILTIRNLEIPMVSMGPLVPHLQTPLADVKPISSLLMQKIIAAARVALPRARIPITTAMEYLWGNEFRKAALQSGANSFMLNLTPAGMRESYDIYPGKNNLAEHIHSVQAMRGVTDIVNACGMRICTGFGKELELSSSEFTAGCSMNR